MAEEQIISVYGNINPYPQYWNHHATTYLEYEIPKRLEKKLEKMIDVELATFHKNCKCPSCKKGRK